MLRNLCIFSFIFALVSCGGGSSAIKNTNNSGNSVVGSSASSNDSSKIVTNASSAAEASASSAEVSSSNSSIASSAQGGEPQNDQLYGMYVSLNTGRTNALLGNVEREDQFIKFVRDNGFNYLIFYDLEGLNPTSTTAKQFAALVSRAKLTAGVKSVAAALGDVSEANTIVAYNNGRPESERINVLNVEYEFWNMPDRATAFNNTIAMLEHFKSVGMVHDLQTEIYVGWINATEAVRLGNVTDRILVHYYMQTDVTIINYGLERLEWLSAASRKVKIAPIFSNEGPKNTNDIPFMGCWLEKNPHQQAYKSWREQYDALNKPWKENIEVVGATWFIYDKFLDVKNLNGNQSGGVISNGCDVQ
ncbi:hypothetical protein [Cellvibrio sp. UBA7671]|uniref:hypothetical protein n=1 Tax=Cellvibrio sp. UBA7671 TaxID=1946312 RepID=UPI002F35F658